MDARICLGSASLFYRLEGRQWVGMKQDWLLFKVGTCVGGGGGGGIIRDILLVIMKISIRMVQKFTFSLCWLIRMQWNYVYLAT